MESLTNKVSVHHGDALSALRALPEASVHAIITDPPYGLADHKPDRVIEALTAWSTGDRERVPTGRGFMGREWDAFVPPPAVWDECLRVLKPGGHLAVFAGSRTVDLMGLSIRLAGFEMRDGIAAWLYGSGFPKSHDVGKAIDKATDAAREWQGWGTALKPAHEPILLARKPLAGTVAANVLAHGAGGIHVDACRVGETVETWPASRSYGTKAKKFDTQADQDASTQRTGDVPSGRWPTNVVLTHHPDCGPDERPEAVCVPGCQVAALDEQSGVTTSSGGKGAASARTKNGRTYGEYAEPDAGGWSSAGGLGDTGGASRFFPTFRYCAKAPKRERPEVDGRGHPTVKPLGLMRWLVRLLCPPDGTILDPFAGSGSTLQAADQEGFRVIGIDADHHSVELVRQRFATAEFPDLFASFPLDGEAG